jgi:hypothetical protein
VRSTRVSLIRRVDVARHTWRRRLSHTAATISIVAGGLLVTYGFHKQRSSRPCDASGPTLDRFTQP